MKIILKNLLTTLRRYPTAVLLNVVGLSVAFTAFVVILMQVRYELSFDRDIPGGESVFRVEQNWEGSCQAVFSQPLIDELTASSAYIQAGSLVEMSGWMSYDFHVERSNGTQNYFRSRLTRTTPPYIEILGLDLIAGDSTVLQRGDQVLVPQSMAYRMFGDEPAVGRMLISDNDTLSVGGVYRDFPANSVFPNALLRGHPWKNGRGNSNYMYFVRLNDPSAVGEVTRAMNGVIRKYYEIGDNEPESLITVRLTNVRDLYFTKDVAYDDLTPKGNRTTTDILLAIAVLVIFIASINFVNFASALTPVRMKMINLQKILGAGVWQLRASLLFESAVIAMAAYALSLCFVATLAQSAFAQYVMADMALGANLPLVAWCALIALGVGLAAGLYPAFYMTSFRPILAIKGSFGTSASGRRYRMVLVGIQYIISLALIISTLFVNLQNRYMTNLDMGYDKAQIVVADLPGDAWEKHEVLTQRLKSYAGIEDVAFAYQKFGADESKYMGWGRSYKDLENGISYKALLVSENFLRTLGIPVAEGRDARPSDEQRECCTYIFNQAGKERYRMELGDYIAQNDTDGPGNHVVGWGEVAGFIPDSVRIYSQHASEEPFAFCVLGTLRWGNQLSHCYIRVKPGVDLMEATEHIRRSISDTTPFDFEIEFMDSVVNSLYNNELKAGVLVTLFSVLAILVSLMGVFGLVLFETQYRRKEIGIRKVNGATSASILGMFNRRFVAIVLVSFVIAAPLAWYGVHVWLQNFRSSVPIYAWVFAAALGIVLLITALTVTIRSWRTANENPIKSVKTE